MPTPPASNDAALSVSDLAASLKRTVETNYDHVVVRGELGRVTIARSGHMYCDLKDEKAVLNTVMWKGQVDRLPFRPEEGLEVIATGRLSIYEGRSNYQMLASSMRPAGAGALMALLEERKKKFAAEGLFAPEHKKKLPFLPKTIGVVTSPTGAVIRDILHRIRDRFPVRVIVWPALVQGDQAAGQITAGIQGFNAMIGADRPDVLIVARGGGSIEDLWPFNEENVVRAAFESEIPLISAVGHETDTTLIDYVSDARAPTPTGAAEIAVPVRSELLLLTGEHGERLKRALARRTGQARDKLAAARLPRPEMLLQTKRQRLDYASSNLPKAALALVQKARLRLSRQSLSPASLRGEIRSSKQRLRDTAVRARPALMRLIDSRKTALASQGKLLETLSYQSTLKRGYAIVRDTDGNLIRSAGVAAKSSAFKVSFGDGDVMARPDGSAPPPSPSTPKPAPKADKPKPKPAPKGDQGSLF
ncbi:MAG: exodeoxyribonuclease VII large subunit [Alphaproteobacteria bacterium]|nr:exodeoxyribonuclease VII large subunit [Hyphomonas sp.]MBR9807770.1 exodeoxyribonuclease VII large subunit [Alphaproteobacteria bacterium]